MYYIQQWFINHHRGATYASAIAVAVRRAPRRLGGRLRAIAWGSARLPRLAPADSSSLWHRRDALQRGGRDLRGGRAVSHELRLRLERVEHLLHARLDHDPPRDDLVDHQVHLPNKEGGCTCQMGKVEAAVAGELWTAGSRLVRRCAGP